MFDIGIGELIVLAIVGLLVFGPEKLPKAAADAGRMLRQVRQMAATARQDLADSAGVDFSDTVDTVKSLGDLHPRRLAASVFADEPETPKKAASSDAQSPPDAAGRAPAFDPDAT